MEERYIAAIDLGSSKIALAIARVTGDDVEVIHYKTCPSEGIRNGYIFNPFKARIPVRRLIDEAERSLGVKISQIITGSPSYAVVEQGAVATINRDGDTRSISEDELDSIKNIATDDVPIDNRETDVIYGAVAQSFTTDDGIQLSAEDVVGMVSDTLSGNFNVYVGQRKKLDNVDKLFNELGIAALTDFFSPATLSEMVLTSDEKDSGVALVDFGGGVTSVSVFKGGILRHYASIPFGGKSVTGDIRLETGFSESLSENIKLAYGACKPDRLANLSDKIIRVSYQESNSADKELKVQYLSRIIDAREKEIVDAILWEIQKSSYADELRSGIVITGGGAEMANLNVLINEMSGYNVRTGYPKRLFSCTDYSEARETAAASCMGLVMAGKERPRLNCCGDVSPRQTIARPPEESVTHDNPSPEVAPGEEKTGDIFTEEEIGPAGKGKQDKKNRKPRTARTPEEMEEERRRKEEKRKNNPVWMKIVKAIDWGDDLFEKSE